MKKQSIGWCLLLSAVLTFGCQNENVDTTPGIEVSDATLKSSGTAIVTLTNVTDTVGITWSIDPAETARIVASGARASIVFSSKGHYTLRAHHGRHTFTTDFDIDSVPDCYADSTFHHNDSTHVGHDSIPSDSLGHYPPHHGGIDSLVVTDTVFIPLKNDVLLVTPLSAVDTLGGTGIYFRVKTMRKYNNSSVVLGMVAGIVGNKITMSCDSVVIPGGGTPGEYSAMSHFCIRPVPHGNNALEITVNGTTYTGTLTNNNGKISIVWNYTDGVIFTSLAL